jgi:hypothetical protein
VKSHFRRAPQDREAFHPDLRQPRVSSCQAPTSACRFTNGGLTLEPERIGDIGPSPVKARISLEFGRPASSTRSPGLFRCPRGPPILLQNSCTCSGDHTVAEPKELSQPGDCNGFLCMPCRRRFCSPPQSTPARSSRGWRPSSLPPVLEVNVLPQPRATSQPM